MSSENEKLTAGSCLQLPSYVKLHHDKARERWVLLAPERVLEPDETALEVVKMCDGKTSVGDIASRLASKYDAPADRILSDIIVMLQDLFDKRFLEQGGKT